MPTSKELTVEALAQLVGSDPYGAVRACETALEQRPNEPELLRVALSALAAVIEDLDEHGEENLNAYSDDVEPSHFFRLKGVLKKRLKALEAPLPPGTFELTCDEPLIAVAAGDQAARWSLVHDLPVEDKFTPVRLDDERVLLCGQSATRLLVAPDSKRPTVTTVSGASPPFNAACHDGRRVWAIERSFWQGMLAELRHDDLTVVNRWPLTGGGPVAVALRGPLLAVVLDVNGGRRSHNSGAVVLFSLADPAPREVARIEVPYPVTGAVFVDDRVLCVESGGLRLFELGDAASPKLLVHVVPSGVTPDDIEEALLTRAVPLFTRDHTLIAVRNGWWEVPGPQSSTLSSIDESSVLASGAWLVDVAAPAAPRSVGSLLEVGSALVRGAFEFDGALHVWAESDDEACSVEVRPDGRSPAGPPMPFVDRDGEPLGGAGPEGPCRPFQLGRRLLVPTGGVRLFAHSG